jgi:hypothetical protein
MSSWSSFSSQVKQRGEGSRRNDPSSSSLTTRPPGKEKQLSTSSSFLGLKAEIAERKGSSKDGGSYQILGKGDKKLPAYLRPSPDVAARSLKNDKRQTTSSWANTPSSQLDAARLAMEKKVAMYEKLKSGGTGGLNEQALQDSLIDWDKKGYEDDGAGSESSASSMEEDDSRRGKGTGINSDDDPMTEYEDDLGRMRRVRRSRVPRSVLQARRKKEEENLSEDMLTYGPSTAFPVFKREDVAEEKGYKRKSDNHFDAQYEKRHRGAGFYQFSQDEETRKKEMEALRVDRDETERERASRGDASDGLSVGERRREERSKLVKRKMHEIGEKKRRLAAQAGPTSPVG